MITETFSEEYQWYYLDRQIFINHTNYLLNTSLRSVRFSVAILP